MIEKLTIRPARGSDAPAALDLIFKIWIDEYGFEVKRTDYPDLLDIEETYAAKGSRFFVADYQGAVIGTIAREELSPGHYVIKRMFVEKSHRGKGIAQRLLEEILKDIGGSSVYLSTKRGEAIAAETFYRKNGFKEVSREQLPEAFPFFYEDDLFMRREL